MSPIVPKNHSAFILTFKQLKNRSYSRPVTLQLSYSIIVGFHFSVCFQHGMPEQLELQQLVETDGSRQDDVERGAGRRAIMVASRCRPCPYLGLLLATLSSLFFSLCSVIVKWLVDVHPMELAACRFVGVLLPAVPIVLWRKESAFPRGRRIMLLLRSFVGTTGLMLSFYAFRHMPLADASVTLFLFVI